MHFSPPFSHCSFYHIDKLFSLKIRYHKQATRIRMSLLIPTVNTKEVPHTVELLTQYLPSVLNSTCFNDDQLPFAVEAQSTEIGHLFEHILLEYLCYFKLLKGYTNAEYSGVTKWNWERDPWGVFHITINTGYDDWEIFSQATQQSIVLLEMILCSSHASSLQVVPMLPISPTFDQVEA